jgi:hypothetical protein
MNQQYGEMNMRGEGIFPLIGFLGLFTTIAFVIYQTMQHRLRMKMIEKGVTNLDLTKIKTPADNSLKYGLVCIALGIAIFMGLAFERFAPELGGEFGLAFVPLFIGFALVASAIVERNRARKNSPPV